MVERVSKPGNEGTPPDSSGSGGSRGEHPRRRWKISHFTERGRIVFTSQDKGQMRSAIWKQRIDRSIINGSVKEVGNQDDTGLDLGLMKMRAEHDQNRPSEEMVAESRSTSTAAALEARSNALRRIASKEGLAAKLAKVKGTRTEIRRPQE